MTKSSFKISIIVLILVLGVTMLLAQPAIAREELVVNGGFEDDWKGWEKYSLGRGYAALDPVNPYDGSYSLSIQGTPTPQSGTRYGSGARQTIEGSNLPLDLEFAFWVKPWVSGKGVVDITATLTLYTSNQNGESSVLKIVYYVAWRGEAESWANIRQDEADYFVAGAGPFSWNYFETNIKNDFEERWGDPGYSLSKIVLNLEITVGYPGTNTEYANWDDVSMTRSYPTSTQTTATSATTTMLTSSSATIETTIATTRTTSTTHTTEGIFQFMQSELTIAIVALVAVSICGIVIAARRRGGKPGKPSAQPNVKYCMNCGATMPLASKYCPKCGSSQ